MKALRILKKQRDEIIEIINNLIECRDPYNLIREYAEKRSTLDASIEELENYEQTMDMYIDYTTGGRAPKSFNADLSFLKSLYDRAHEDPVF